MVRSLEAIERWPGSHGAAALRCAGGEPQVVARSGNDGPFPFASVTKLAASLAVLVEVAAGRCGLDDAAGPPGSTLEHLLAHASGLPLDAGRPLFEPGVRRIYSNVGIELAVAHAASRARRADADLVANRVLAPLEMTKSTLEGSVASGLVGTVADAGRLAAELLAPRLIPEPLAVRAGRVAFPGLDGVLPGFGRQSPCDFGLGPEVKGTKHPHWTGASWPAWALGHFGQRGGFVVVDRVAGIALVTLGDEPFGPWAKAAWPAFTDAVRAELLGQDA